jgi:hypothetical protein
MIELEAACLCRLPIERAPGKRLPETQLPRHHRLLNLGDIVQSGAHIVVMTAPGSHHP